MDDDLLQRMKKDRDAIADIMKEIPLLGEYVENSSLWEADRIIRLEVARRLDGLKGPVNDAVLFEHYFTSQIAREVSTVSS